MPTKHRTRPFRSVYTAFQALKPLQRAGLGDRQKQPFGPSVSVCPSYLPQGDGVLSMILPLHPLFIGGVVDAEIHQIHRRHCGACRLGVICLLYHDAYNILSKWRAVLTGTCMWDRPGSFAICCTAAAAAASWTARRSQSEPALDSACMSSTARAANSKADKPCACGWQASDDGACMAPTLAGREQAAWRRKSASCCLHSCRPPPSKHGL